MVGKIVRSSPFWSIVIFLGICVAAVLLTQRVHQPQPVYAQAPGDAPEEGTEISITQARQIVGMIVPYYCWNSVVAYFACGQCDGGLCPTFLSLLNLNNDPDGSCSGACTTTPTGDVPPRSPQFNTEGSEQDPFRNDITQYTSAGNSLIDTASANYIHYSDDYMGPGPTHVHLRRFHRFRNITEVPSFGPSCFSNYDVRLHLSMWQVADGYGFYTSGNTAGTLFDPTAMFEKHLYLDTSSNGTRYADNAYRSYKDITLTDSAGNAVTTPYSSGPLPSRTAATHAVLRTWTGESYWFELFENGELTVNSADEPWQPMDGRLVKILDQNGYGTTLTYKTWTSLELEEAPDRQWQIDEITDSYGQSLQFSYESTQVGGFWAVSQIDLPNSESLTYGYTGGILTDVTLPDGSEATISLTTDSTSNCGVFQFDDPGATGVHRRKKVHMHGAAGSWNGNLVSIAEYHVRLVINGEDEVSYLSIPYDWYSLIYEGRGRLKQATGGYAGMWSQSYITDNDWTVTVDPEMWEVNISYDTIGDTYSEVDGYYTTAGSTTPQGVTREFTRNADKSLASVNFEGDTLKEEWSYVNGIYGRRVSRYEDRLGRVTRYTYDSKGNMLTKEVGLKKQPGPEYQGYLDGYDAGFDDGNAMDPADDSTSNMDSNYVVGYEAGYAHGYDDGINTNGHGASSNPTSTAMVDAPTADHAVYEWEFYTAGSHVGLLSKSIDPNGNETDYAYDTNHRLDTITYPPDVAMGTRAVRDYTYDSAGRVIAITQPGGWGTSYDYDERNRVVKVEHADNSTERFIYGTGVDANLLVKHKNRAGVVTKYEYDDAGRKVKTIQAYSTMDLSDNETAITDPAIKTQAEFAYVNGTNTVRASLVSGDYRYNKFDYHHRVIESSVVANTAKTLTSKSNYVAAKLFNTEDPYGRKTYYAYDSQQAKLIRTIRCTVPSVSYADFTAVLAATRASENAENPTSLITDYVYDTQGQTLKVIDPRGVEHHKEYDSLGRVTADIRAAQWLGGAPTNCVARTEYDYDDASNVVATRHPRWFDSGDTNGYHKCVTTMTYTGRNLLKTRTEADGATEEATESFTYNLDAQQLTHVDFNGKTWTNTYGSCCGRLQTSADPLGHGTITNHDALGRVTHQAWVSDVSSHSSAWDNPIDAKTLKEVTTKYDARGRVAARTVWVNPLGAVNPNSVPIHNGAVAWMPMSMSGFSQSQVTSGTPEGLTTSYAYDDDLDDGAGLDDDFSTHLSGLALDDDSDGSAVLTTVHGHVPHWNSAAAITSSDLTYRTLTIRDGRGRTIRSVRLDSSDNAVERTTQVYDAVVSIGGYGDVVETTSTNLAGHSNKHRADGASRRIATIDGDSKLTSYKYNANGNRLKVRDPNSIGMDCTYDALGRDISCIDTASHGTAKQFDRAGNMVIQIDAKSSPASIAYDARNRKLSVTDRISAVTTWAWDANGNELSMTDAENQTTSYSYDDAGNRTSTTWPDHVTGQNPGDANCGITSVLYDALGRPVRTTDQQGDKITLHYDLAGRRYMREAWPLSSPAPETHVAYRDYFLWTADGQLVNALRATTDVDYTLIVMGYENGRKTSETLKFAGGQAYTVAMAYGTDGRVSQLTYPDSTIVDRTYNARGLLSTISYGGGTIDSRTYDDGGRLTSETLGNGLTVTTSYATGENLIASIANGVVGTYGYSWDANHNKTAETITGAMSGYGFTVPTGGYDDEDRLTAWERDDSGLDQAWSLSDVGDWNTFTENGTPQTRTHGNAHELTAIAANALTYDSKGNLTQDTTGRTYAWSIGNQLTSTTLSGTTVSYAYDALDRRIGRTTSGTTTHYVSNGDIVLAEYTSGTAASNSLRKYINASYVDEPVLLIDRTAAGGTGAGTDERLYYHRNQQYSITALTDNGGSVVERYHYTAHGRATIRDAAGTSVLSASNYDHSILFSGRSFDHIAGLYYFRARYYSDSLGRFISRDPRAYVDGSSLYQAYFGTSAGDPSGTATQCFNPCTPNGCGAAGSFFDPVPDRPLRNDFTPCCNLHDICYCQCGIAKEACDEMFFNCMRQVCDQRGLGRGRLICLGLARTYRNAVRDFGGDPFDKAQVLGCLN
ncbi:tRNA(Glu)-specific nuclease WapA precursor [Caulifigura coniformis]|uniref:tRNA(Glu)-specific nuclease WapA n=1 Tax=Caulifigura coniformis TaxID=2527983 RepID=A0A517SMB6_9PLAN|nr:RHS repeat-associated core domain-containing protein [Caulifigura coniformis]QDT57272.1 tRNA(Glu)-specific nuclease WapA precursor [Caulifigura coniformis]